MSGRRTRPSALNDNLYNYVRTWQMCDSSTYTPCGEKSHASPPPRTHTHRGLLQVMKSILRQTLEGTQFLHERGILHRDLKPSNLIVSLPPTVVRSSPPRAAASAAATDTASDAHEPPGDRRKTSPAAATTTPVTAAVGLGWGWAGGGGSSSGSSSTNGNNHSKRRRRGAGERGGWGGRGPGSESGSSRSTFSSSSSSSFSSSSSLPVLLKVTDFSSAVDEGAIAAGLYGATGPSHGEETLQYAPPEVLFDPEVRCTTFGARLVCFVSSGVWIQAEPSIKTVVVSIGHISANIAIWKTQLGRLLLHLANYRAGAQLCKRLIGHGFAFLACTVYGMWITCTVQGG